MKKLILFALIAAVSLSAYSAPKLTDYVVTDDGITYFVNVRHGISDFLIGKTEEGTKVRFKKSEINSYRKSGEVFQKKQVIINGKVCEDCTFLRLLKTKNGCGFYVLQSYENGVKHSKFYVYNGDRYVLEVNMKNYLQMFNFFKIT